ncbi:MAG: DUF4157 domain-containing protein, partial [Chloroflexi bacterium]|nr:DUF4157 domain-containing protein [Chloroflexota bacterium]
RWAANDERVEFWELDAGTSRGGNDIFKSGTQPLDVTSLNVTFPPGTIYVRLNYFSGGRWSSMDTAYQVPAGLVEPEITSPKSGSALVGGSATFEWTGNSAVDDFRLTAGKDPGSPDIFDANKLSSSDRSISVSGIPTDGLPVFVRLWWLVNDVWAFNDYAYSSPSDALTVPSGTPPADETAPITTIEFAGSHVFSGGTHFINPDTQIYFLSTDENPVTIEYFVDSGSFRPAFPFKISQPGLYTVFYRGTDTEVNVEATKSASVSVSGGDASPRPGSPDADESGPAISLQATNLNGPGPVRAGDLIGVDVTPGNSNDRLINRVDFFVDGLLYASDDLSPFRSVFRAPSDSTGQSLAFEARAFTIENVAGPTALLKLSVNQGVSVVIVSQSDTVVEGRTTLLKMLIQGGVAPFDVTFLQDGVSVSTGASVMAFTAPVGSAGQMFNFTARVVDSQTTTAQSALKQIRVVAPPANPNDPGTGVLYSAADNVGKVSGRAVIGELVHLDGSLIVVATGDGFDFTDVRVHVDARSTRFSASLDAEAFTHGSRVVVVADRDLSDPRATAISITHIPGPGSKADRTHRRALVVDPDAGNTEKYVDGNGAVLTGKSTGDLDARSGDQIVLIVSKDGQGRDVVRTITPADVNDRLNDFAQDKANRGEFDDSAGVDRLRDLNRSADQTLVGVFAGHFDPDVRVAADDADSRIKKEREKDASDPLVTLRKQAVADAEESIRRCFADATGHPVSGEADVSADEIRRFGARCLADDDPDGGDRGIPEQRDPEDGPDPETLACIAGVLGGGPPGQIDAQLRDKLSEICGPNDNGRDDGPDPGDDGGGATGPGAGDVDARKIAYCEANQDPRCESIGQRDEPATDAEFRAFCQANPRDLKCQEEPSVGDRDGVKDPDATEKPGDGSPSTPEEKDAFCALNPTDGRCVDDAGGDDPGGTKDPGAGTKDGAADPSGPKDGAGGK